MGIIKREDTGRIMMDDKVLIEVTDSALDLEPLFAVLVDVAGPSIEAQRNLILIVPSDLESRYDGVAFPGGTREFFRYLRERVGDQATVEAAVRDDDYQEFEFLSVDIILPVLYVANSVLLPIAINLLSDWIFRLLHTDGGRESDRKVQSEVHFDQQGRLKRMKYEGPASTFENIMLEALRKEGEPCSSHEDHDDKHIH